MKKWFCIFGIAVTALAAFSSAAYTNLPQDRGRGSYIAIPLALLAAMASIFAVGTEGNPQTEIQWNVVAWITVILAAAVICGAALNIFEFYAFTGGDTLHW